MQADSFRALRCQPGRSVSIGSRPDPQRKEGACDCDKIAFRLVSPVPVLVEFGSRTAKDRVNKMWTRQEKTKKALLDTLVELGLAPALPLAENLQICEPRDREVFPSTRHLVPGLSRGGTVSVASGFTSCLKAFQRPIPQECKPAQGG